MTALDLAAPDALLLDLFVPGDPAPQGSKRAFRNQHSGRIQQVESSKRAAPWREDIRQAVLAHIDIDTSPTRHTPLVVELDFALPRPLGHFGTGRNAGAVRASAPARPAGKPDIDKLARAVLDAIGSAGVVWEDDAQVVQLSVAKQYAVAPGSRGVRIRVRRAEP